MQIFLYENICKSVSNYMEVIEDMFKVCKKQNSQNWQMSYFKPLYQVQLSISQNRPVRLVFCFVEVHHIYEITYYLFEIP